MRRVRPGSCLARVLVYCAFRRFRPCARATPTHPSVRNGRKGVEILKVGRRQQRPPLKAHGRLDEARHASRRIGVADVALDRPDRTVGR